MVEPEKKTNKQKKTKSWGGSGEISGEEEMRDGGAKRLESGVGSDGRISADGFAYHPGLAVAHFPLIVFLKGCQYVPLFVSKRAL